MKWVTKMSKNTTRKDIMIQTLEIATTFLTLNDQMTAIVFKNCIPSTYYIYVIVSLSKIRHFSRRLTKSDFKFKISYNVILASAAALCSVLLKSALISPRSSTAVK